MTKDEKPQVNPHSVAVQTEHGLEVTDRPVRVVSGVPVYDENDLWPDDAPNVGAGLERAKPVESPVEPLFVEGAWYSPEELADAAQRAGVDIHTVRRVIESLSLAKFGA